MVRLISSSLSLVILSGCVISGGPTETKNPLQVLNGKNYDTGPTGPPLLAGVPVVKTRERESTIDGVVQIQEGMTEIPLRFVAVALVDREKKIVVQATTDADGKFRLRGIIPNGSYELQLLSKKYAGTQNIVIKSFETSAVTLVARSI